MGFGKLMTAMVTIFDEHGELNEKENRKIVKKLCDEGTEVIVVSGTTGEGPTLSLSEKMKLTKWVVEEKTENVKVIINVGTNNTKETVETIKVFQEVKGVDGLMAVCPYYNKPSQEGLFKHFEKISEVSNLPVMVYHIPGRTNVTMTIETLQRIVELPNIKMVKESSGNLEKTAELIRYIETKKLPVTVYCGDDPYTLNYLTIGAKGVVSVVSHLVGKDIRRMLEHFEKGEYKEAREIQFNITSVAKKCFPPFAPNPVGVKYLLSKKGWGNEEVRLPLVKMTKEEKSSLE
jgi:4-hydroxy-tetrahydrodipicolinate synthase